MSSKAISNRELEIQQLPIDTGGGLSGPSVVPGGGGGGLAAGPLPPPQQPVAVGGSQQSQQSSAAQAAPPPQGSLLNGNGDLHRTPHQYEPHPQFLSKQHSLEGAQLNGKTYELSYNDTGLKYTDQKQQYTFTSQSANTPLSQMSDLDPQDRQDLNLPPNLDGPMTAPGSMVNSTRTIAGAPPNLTLPPNLTANSANVASADPLLKDLPPASTLTNMARADTPMEMDGGCLLPYDDSRVYEGSEALETEPLSKIKIIDVYTDNLHEEFAKIRKAVKRYPYVAMDTEFPGCVAVPERKTKYQQIRVNVDLLNIIQLGMCFMDEDGEMDPDNCCWQFNFKFNTETDMYNEVSLNLLKKAGIPFKTLEEKGVDRQIFAEMFITSGICLNNKVHLITFHAGYDFAYLLKLMRNDAALPENEGKFFDLLKLYFPNIYDIKYMVKSLKIYEGGLERIAKILDVKRVGSAHMAGSDSILTGETFMKIRGRYFSRNIKEERQNGNANDENGEDSPFSNDRMAEATEILPMDHEMHIGDDDLGGDDRSDSEFFGGEKTQKKPTVVQSYSREVLRQKYSGVIYGIGSGILYHDNDHRGARNNYNGNRHMRQSFSQYGLRDFDNQRQSRSSSLFHTKPNPRNINTPPGIAIVKPPPGHVDKRKTPVSGGSSTPGADGQKLESLSRDEKDSKMEHGVVGGEDVVTSEEINVIPGVA